MTTTLAPIDECYAGRAYLGVVDPSYATTVRLSTPRTENLSPKVLASLWRRCTRKSASNLLRSAPSALMTYGGECTVPLSSRVLPTQTTALVPTSLSPLTAIASAPLPHKAFTAACTSLE